MKETSNKQPHIVVRRARLEDVRSIMELNLAGGPDGNSRGQLPDPIPSGYLQAYQRIADNSNAQLMVAELAGEIVGTFQINFLTYLAAANRDDCQIESVHVRADHRSHGIGAIMMNWAIDCAKDRGCRRVQLTTNKMRKSAHRFYERLGFVASHEGMKLSLNEGK